MRASACARIRVAVGGLRVGMSLGAAIVRCVGSVARERAYPPYCIELCLYSRYVSAARRSAGGGGGVCVSRVCTVVCATSVISEELRFRAEFFKRRFNEHGTATPSASRVPATHCHSHTAYVHS